MRYFFDTSAVVKLYHHEQGSQKVLPLYHSGKDIVLSEIGKVELLSTIHKKLRTGDITTEAMEAVRDRFLVDCAIRFVVVHVASFIVDTALGLFNTFGKTHHLFSLDALQIATFSSIGDKDSCFVCADKRLVTLVKSMGFKVMEL